MKFDGKVAVVTGGSKGIGRCIVEMFVAQGASVAIFDKADPVANTIETIDSPAKPCRKSKMGELFVRGDAAKQEDLERFARAVIDTYGSVDFLINNACFSNGGILSSCSYEAFNEILHVGVTAPYYLSMLFMKHFNPGASIVNISSTRAFMSQRDTESYTAAKGGITALTHGLAMSLAGIARVNSVAPGWIDTRAWQGDSQPVTPVSEADKLQHPSQRIGEPHDIAQVVQFLCSQESGFINGENITVDGGMTKRMIYHGDEGWAFTP